MNFLSSTFGGQSQAQQDRIKEISARRRTALDHSSVGEQRPEGKYDASSSIATRAFNHPDATSMNTESIASSSCSDFEQISETEAIDPNEQRQEPQPGRATTRSRSTRTRSRSSHRRRSGSSQHRDLSPSPPRASTSRRPIEPISSSSNLSDAADADNEDDSRGRGRGRTRRREDDPTVRKTLLEDALRSSLATLLTLGAPHQSQSPAMSHVSLASLAVQSSINDSRSMRSPPSTIGGARSPFAGTRSPFVRSAAGAVPRASPFANALTDTFEIDDNEEEVVGAGRSNDRASPAPGDHSSASEDALDLYSSSSSDDGTELAPRPSTSAVQDSATSMSSNQSTAKFSPIQSRPLQLSSSLPASSSRTRRRRRSSRHRDSRSSRSNSAEEERRGDETESDTELVERDTHMLDSADASSTFTASSSGLEYHESSDPVEHLGYSSALGPISPRIASLSTDRIAKKWDAEQGPASPSSSFPTSETFLPSSAPTIDLSSEADDSPSRKAVDRGRKLDAAPTSSSSTADSPSRRKGVGWLAFWDRSIELKVWQLVGLCGLFIGIGVGTAPFLQNPSRIAARVLSVSW